MAVMAAIPPFPPMQQCLEKLVATIPSRFHSNLYKKHGGLDSHLFISMQEHTNETGGHESRNLTPMHTYIKK